MRTMWKGAISFGLVTIPIKLYTATESKEISFRQLHAECRSPIQYRKFCPACNREVAAEEIIRGYEYAKGQFVIISDEELEKIPLSTLRAIEIMDFVDLREIDPIYFVKTYFLAPGDYGAKPYRLLFDALKESGRIAIAKVVLRQKESLAALRVFENCLAMEMLFYPDEIRSPAGMTELAEIDGVRVHENELRMARMLIDSLTARFEPAKYTSEYRQALMELIRAKIEGQDVEVPERPAPTKVVDLMEALRASIEATARERGDARRAGV